MATTTKTRRGFQVHCPYCGEEGSLRMQVDDLHELTCGNCDTEFNATMVRGIIAGWQALLAWIETAPTRD